MLAVATLVPVLVDAVPNLSILYISLVVLAQSFSVVEGSGKQVRRVSGDSPIRFAYGIVPAAAGEGSQAIPIAAGPFTLTFFFISP
jgi:hypothetical protein